MQSKATQARRRFQLKFQTGAKGGSVAGGVLGGTAFQVPLARAPEVLPRASARDVFGRANDQNSIGEHR